MSASTPRPRVRGAIALLAGIGLVVAAWGALQLAPSTETTQASVVVTADLGERGEGRDIAATVYDVVIAESLTDASSEWNGATSGQWIVVNATAGTLIRSGKK